MTTSRLQAALSDPAFVRVPHVSAVYGVKENPYSKRLRQFDNKELDFPAVLNQGHGVYINTNEHKTNTTLKALNSFPSAAQGMHIGFSGWHNFDIIAQRRSERALICDINPENALFLHQALFYLCRCKTRGDFVVEMAKFVKSHDHGPFERSNKLDIYFEWNVSEEPPYDAKNHTWPSDEIYLELKRETSWLFTDERFNHLKALAMNDQIVLITESICAHEKFANIARFLQDNASSIDTIYVSNIAHYMKQADLQENYLKTMQHLFKDNQTIVIDAIRSAELDEYLTHNLEQRCMKVADIKKSGLREWLFKEPERQDMRKNAKVSDNLISKLSIKI